MLPLGTRPLLYASTIQVSALAPGELGDVNSGLPAESRTCPPNAAVIWYQQVDRPSAAAKWMSSGLAIPCERTLSSAAENSLSVDGTLETPAFWKSLELTVVTMNDASNGIPTSWPRVSKVASCGMSCFRLLALNHLPIGRNQPVFAYSPTLDQSTSVASAK